MRAGGSPYSVGMKADTVHLLASRPISLLPSIIVAWALLGFPSGAAVAQYNGGNPQTAQATQAPPASQDTGGDPSQQAGDEGKVFGPDGQELTDAECEAIPGGKAPIERIARLPGSMSVRNLELAYYGKPLHAFTDEDFEYLKILKPFCEGTPSKIDAVIFDRLKEKVDEARATREKAVRWINATKDKLDAMPPSPEAVRAVHNAWTEMENRDQEMLAADLNYFATYLDDRRQALYEGKPAQQRVLISPFQPGPTIPPDAKE